MMPEVIAKTKASGVFAVKGVDKKNRRICGYFTTRDEDREGDVILPHWFEKTISPGGNYYKNPVVLYNHDSSEIIGHCDVDTLAIDEVGVYGEFIVTSDSRWEQIDNGDLRGFSWFGYVMEADEEVDLVEVTLTPIPCNPNAIFEIKKKALQLGLCAESDFPETIMPTAEELKAKWKSVNLGYYLESEMSMAAIATAMSALMWRSSWLMEDTYSPLDERMGELKKMVDEFGELVVRTATAILPSQQQSELAIKTIRETWDAPEVPASTGDVGGGGRENMPVEKEEVQSLINEAMAPVTTALKGISDFLTAKATETPAPAPAAAPAPAPVAAPAAVPAEKSVVAPASNGEIDYDKLAAAIVSKGIKPAAPEGIVEEPVPAGTPAADGRETRVKSLVEAVKATSYATPGVQHKWRGHIEDALSIELVGRNFDEVSASEEMAA